MPVRLVKSLLETDVSEGEAALAAEADHRIANSLALVGGLLRMHAAAVAKQGSPVPPEEASSLLLEAADRVETVGHLHRRLAGRGAEVDLADVIQEVAEATIASQSLPGQAKLRLRLARGCAAPPRMALALSLIVGELVTNSLKYAHPTKVAGLIEIRLCCRPGDPFEVVVRDDGVGLPEGFDPSTSGGLGLRLVRALSSQIEAKLSFVSDGVGLVARIEAPAQGGKSARFLTPQREAAT